MSIEFSVATGPHLDHSPTIETKKILTKFFVTINPHSCFCGLFNKPQFFLSFVNMTIDNVLNVQHLQQVQNYPFVVSDCLFDLMSFLFHHSQTSPKLRSQYCMAHFAQSVQQPTLAFQEIINIHFDASLLYKNQGIRSLQTYVDKMPISAKYGGLWGDNCAIFYLANYLRRPIYVWSKRNCMIWVTIL
jgi:hypothetical protein